MPHKRYRLAPPMENKNVSTRLPPIVVIYRPNDKVKQISSPHWWFVLPCLLLIILCTASDPILMNDLIIRRYEHYYGLSGSIDTHRTACQEQTMIPMFYWDWEYSYFDFQRQYPDYSHVQRDAARFNVRNSIATLVSSVFTFILLGSNSDLIGRRPLLVFPFIGKIIRYALMLMIVSQNLSNNWIIITHVLEGIFGSGGLIILSSFAYITDCTNQSRTRSFFIAEIVIVIARIIPVVGISLWLRYYFYIAPLSVNLALSVIGLFYTLFIQPESVEIV